MENIEKKLKKKIFKEIYVRKALTKNEYILLFM